MGLLRQYFERHARILRNAPARFPKAARPSIGGPSNRRGNSLAFLVVAQSHVPPTTVASMASVSGAELRTASNR